MSKSVLDIAMDHGDRVRELTLEYVVSIAKIYRDSWRDQPLDDFIEHIQGVIESEREDAGHTRWSAEHRQTCDECRRDYDDAIDEMNRDAELDA